MLKYIICTDRKTFYFVTLIIVMRNFVLPFSLFKVGEFVCT